MVDQAYADLSSLPVAKAPVMVNHIPGFLSMRRNAGEPRIALLLDKGFHIYLTADHGNVEAIGQGRPNQGVAPELRGERVRAYRNEALAIESAVLHPDTYRFNIAGLPADFKLLFAGNRNAFVPKGEQVVVQGGISVEELIVPFIKISYVS